MIEAKVIYVDGLQFVGEAASGHAIVMDGDKEVGGEIPVPDRWNCF